MFALLLSVLVPYLIQLPGIWVDALNVFPYLIIIIVLDLIYDGYLSIQTGMIKAKGSLIRGRSAVVAGVIQVGVSIFCLGFLLSTFGTSWFF